MMRSWELEPRSHGGLRLNGDLPGRSMNRWRVLGFVYLPKEEVFHGWRVESLSSTRGDRMKYDVVERFTTYMRLSIRVLTWTRGKARQGRGMTSGVTLAVSIEIVYLIILEIIKTETVKRAIACF
jgi:hypothetical protein